MANILQVLKLLPEHHLKVLETVVRYLNEVSSFSDKNFMTANNIAIVFAPNLLRPRIETPLTLISTLFSFPFPCLLFFSFLSPFLLHSPFFFSFLLFLSFLFFSLSFPLSSFQFQFFPFPFIFFFSFLSNPSLSFPSLPFLRRCRSRNRPGCFPHCRLRNLFPQSHPCSLPFPFPFLK